MKQGLGTCIGALGAVFVTKQNRAHNGKMCLEIPRISNGIYINMKTENVRWLHNKNIVATLDFTVIRERLCLGAMRVQHWRNRA